jgi:hypothetical protein
MSVFGICRIFTTGMRVLSLLWMEFVELLLFFEGGSYEQNQKETF